MSKKQSYRPDQTRCVIFAAGKNAELIANSLEQYAYEQELAIVDTIFSQNKDLGELIYYMGNDSIETVLLRSLDDISTDKKEIKRFLTLAEKHGVSINCEDKDYIPVTENHEDV